MNFSFTANYKIKKKKTFLKKINYLYEITNTENRLINTVSSMFNTDIQLFILFNHK